jgi:hypothetical protein
MRAIKELHLETPIELVMLIARLAAVIVTLASLALSCYIVYEGIAAHLDFSLEIFAAFLIIFRYLLGALSILTLIAAYAFKREKLLNMVDIIWVALTVTLVGLSIVVYYSYPGIPPKDGRHEYLTVEASTAFFGTVGVLLGGTSLYTLFQRAPLCAKAYHCIR